MQPKHNLLNYNNSKNKLLNNNKHCLRKRHSRSNNYNSNYSKPKWEEQQVNNKFNNCKHNYRPNNNNSLQKKHKCNNKWLKSKLSKTFFQTQWVEVTIILLLKWHLTWWWVAWVCNNQWVVWTMVVTWDFNSLPFKHTSFSELLSLPLFVFNFLRKVYISKRTSHSRR